MIAWRVADAIVAAYAGDAEQVAIAWPAGASPEEADPRSDPPWSATVEEAIGLLGAGPDARGVFRVGGDLLVSRDALATLERDAPGAYAQGDEALARLVDATLSAPGVALEGVRSLASVRDVIAAAMRGA